MKRNIVLTLGLVAAGVPVASQAGGLFLYEDGTPSVGLAGAGYARFPLLKSGFLPSLID